MKYYGTMHSEVLIREAIGAAKPGKLVILSFPKHLEQEVRQILADTWDEYTYAMNMDKENVAILSFIVNEGENEDLDNVVETPGVPGGGHDSVAHAKSAGA